MNNHRALLQRLQNMISDPPDYCEACQLHLEEMGSLPFEAWFTLCEVYHCYGRAVNEFELFELMDEENAVINRTYTMLEKKRCVMTMENDKGVWLKPWMKENKNGFVYFCTRLCEGKNT